MADILRSSAAGLPILLTAIEIRLQLEKLVSGPSPATDSSREKEMGTTLRRFRTIQLFRRWRLWGAE
jgi:hypothetical protein